MRRYLPKQSLSRPQGPSGRSFSGRQQHGDGDKGALRVGDNEGAQPRGGVEQTMMETKVEAEVEMDGEGGMEQSLDA